ncbi:MAG: thioredoxin family protein [Bdellovibrionales bacterium]|nr:thioredoxin family protein [Bdellovibrionales bacterium]
MTELPASDVQQLLYVFGAGFLSSLTPCVYPMIPITLSVFGANKEVSRAKSFFLALCYVFGIAFTYTSLGILTAKTGLVFGSFLGNPLVVIFLSTFLLFLALHSLEIISFDFGFLQTKASRLGGRGFAGAFVMGAVSGVVAAPCIGPVLAVVLLEAAKTHNMIWGGALLLSYSLGLGMIFLALGMSSGLLNRLPRSGNWLNGVKFFISVGVLAASLSLLISLDSQSFHELLQLRNSILLVVGVFAAVALPAAYISYQQNRNGGKFASSLALALFAVLVFSERTQKNGEVELQWLDHPQIALERASERSLPVMIDLYADWCIACKKLDSKTFSDQRVAQKLSRHLVSARVDFTQETPESEALSEKFGVVGLPCILFLDKSGAEIPNSRISGFVGPEDFLKHLESIREPV